MLEFLQRLVAEVAAIHQEQHAARAGELDEPVDERDGGECLARSGGHLDQRARAILPQGLLQAADRLALRRPQAFFLQRRHILQAGQQRAAVQVGGAGFSGLHVRRRFRTVLEQLCQRGGCVEREHAAGAWLRIEAVGESRFRASGLIRERQRVAPARQAGGQPLGVFLSLVFHAAQRDALLLGLDDAGRLAIDIQQVIREAVAGQRELADRHAARGVDAGLVRVLNVPAREAEQPIDLFAGALFRRCHVAGAPGGGELRWVVSACRHGESLGHLGGWECSPYGPRAHLTRIRSRAVSTRVNAFTGSRCPVAA